MDKRAKDKLARSPREGGGRQDAQKDLQELEGTRRRGRPKKRWKEEVERSSSAGSEKMERVGERWEKMEGQCSTGRSPQWAVVPMEEEEEGLFNGSVSSAKAAWCQCEMMSVRASRHSLPCR